MDFEKGCYTGQEVVARMYYRSKAKKRLYKLHSSQSIPTGNFSEADILDVAAAADGKQVALGIVKNGVRRRGGGSGFKWRQSDSER